MSIQFKGKITLVLTDSRTNVSREIKVENTITDWVYKESVFFVPLRFPVLSNISISTDANPVDEFNATLINVTATTSEPAGTERLRLYENNDPYLGEIYGRIDFVQYDRVFNKVALTDAPSGNIQDNITALMYAGVLLDTPCTQGAFDILDIFYRIEFVLDGITGYDLSNKALVKRFGRQVFGRRNDGLLGAFQADEFSLTSQKVYSILYPGKSTNNIYEFFNYAGNLGGWLFDIPGNRFVGKSWIIKSFYHLYKFRQIIEITLNEVIGTVLTSIGVSELTLKPFLQAQATAIQNTFTHSSDATTYFFDSLKLALGSGKVIPSQMGAWTGDFPKMYRYNIKTGGDSSATYTLSKRSHFGFNGSTFNDSSPTCPFKPNGILGSHADLTREVLNIGNNELLFYDDTGITRVNIWNGNHKTFDLARGGLAVVALKQICVGGDGTIYAACRTNGLWSIDPVSGVASQRIGLACYGVDTGFGGKVWAIYQGGISNSDNFATSIPITNATIAANWSLVQCLRCDRITADQRIAIALPRSITWYLPSTGATTSTASDSVHQNITINPNTLKVNKSGVFAVANVSSLVRFYNFNSATFVEFYTEDFGEILVFLEDELLTYRRTIKTDGTIGSTTNSLGQSVHRVVLDNKTILNLSTYAFLSIFPHSNPRCWTEYGWNGTQWVEGGVNAKAVHTDVQPTIDNLAIRFTIPQTNGTSFVANDWYSHGANFGVLKDNATTLLHEFSNYAKPIEKRQVNITIPASPYVPTPARYWRVRALDVTTSKFDVRQLIFRDTTGSALSLTGGSAISYGNRSGVTYNAAKAFDNDGNSFWADFDDRGFRGLPWVGYFFATDVTVGSLIINMLNFAPAKFVLESSSNGVDWILASAFEIIAPVDNTPYLRSFPYSSAIIPIVTADPNVVGVDTESSAASSLLLNGIAPATTYYDAYGAVGMNEIALVNPNSLVANMANAGQIVSGEITVVKYS